MQLLAVFLLTTVIHSVNTGAFAAQLAGVRTGRLALASSVYNLLALVSRGANAVVGPLIALMTDQSALAADTADLMGAFRVVLLAATAGTGLAGLLIPSLSRVLARGVAAYEQRRSLPQVVVRGASIRGLGLVRQDLRRPTIETLRATWRSPFSRRFLAASVLVWSVFTVGNLAALYASALVPPGARTAASLAPLLTGLAVVVRFLAVDPVAALVTDQALRGERPVPDVTYIVIWQVGAQLAGTLLAQLLLVPTGQALAGLTRWLVSW